MRAATQGAAAHPPPRAAARAAAALGQQARAAANSKQKRAAANGKQKRVPRVKPVELRMDRTAVQRARCAVKRWDEEREHAVATATDTDPVTAWSSPWRGKAHAKRVWTDWKRTRDILLKAGLLKIDWDWDAAMRFCWAAADVEQRRDDHRHNCRLEEGDSQWQVQQAEHRRHLATAMRHNRWLGRMHKDGLIRVHSDDDDDEDAGLKLLHVPDVVPTPARQLPVLGHRAEITDKVGRAAVTFVSATTGSGKTTQVPQMILDEAIDAGRGDRCRVWVVQPRRMAAIFIAERVAWERGERAGRSVGYHVRSRSTENGKRWPRLPGYIAVMTTGIMRRRMARDPLLPGVTHVVIDEVHERGMDTDFILAVLRDLQRRERPDLKIVIMSATLCAEKLLRYFLSGGRCPGPVEMVEVSQSLFQVRTEYYPPAEWKGAEVNMDHVISVLQEIGRRGDGTVLIFVPGLSDIWKLKQLVEQSEFRDRCKDSSMLSSCDSLPQFFKQGVTGVTVTKSFTATTKKQKTSGKGGEGGERREGKSMYNGGEGGKGGKGGKRGTGRAVVKAGQKGEIVNIDTAGDALINFCHLSPSGSMAKTPLWVQRKDFDNLTMTQSLYRVRGKALFHVVPAHSRIRNHRSVLEPPPGGRRKVVIATNIAETSITIPDVACVIDTGVAKVQVFKPGERLYELRRQRITKMNATQRLGRAGRTRDGVCYRLYSEEKYEAMEESPEPEISRSCLQSICLDACLLGKDPGSFSQQMLDPPPPSNVEAAVEELLRMGALHKDDRDRPFDNSEYRVTPFGNFASMMLLPGRQSHAMAKALAYSAMLGGLETTLAIAAAGTAAGGMDASAHMDPSQRSLRRPRIRRSADASLGDHIAAARLFTEWERLGTEDRSIFAEEKELDEETLEEINDYYIEIQETLKQHGLFKSAARNGHNGHSAHNGRHVEEVVALMSSAMHIARRSPVQEVPPRVRIRNNNVLLSRRSSAATSSARRSLDKYPLVVIDAPSRASNSGGPVRTGGYLSRQATPVSALGAALFAASLSISDVDGDTELAVMDWWLPVSAARGGVELVMKLRERVGLALERRLAATLAAAADRAAGDDFDGYDDADEEEPEEAPPSSEEAADKILLDAASNLLRRSGGDAAAAGYDAEGELYDDEEPKARGDAFSDEEVKGRGDEEERAAQVVSVVPTSAHFTVKPNGEKKRRRPAEAERRRRGLAHEQTDFFSLPRGKQVNPQFEIVGGWDEEEAVRDGQGGTLHEEGAAQRMSVGDANGAANGHELSGLRFVGSKAKAMGDANGAANGNQLPLLGLAGSKAKAVATEQEDEKAAAGDTGNDAGQATEFKKRIAKPYEPSEAPPTKAIFVEMDMPASVRTSVHAQLRSAV